MNYRKGIIVNETEEVLVEELRTTFKCIDVMNGLLKKANGYPYNNARFNHMDYGFNYLNKATIISSKKFKEVFSLEGEEIKFLRGEACGMFEHWDEYVESNFENTFNVIGVSITQGIRYLNIATGKGIHEFKTLPLSLFDEYYQMHTNGEKLIIIN